MNRSACIFILLFLGCSTTSKNYQSSRFTNLKATLTSESATFKFKDSENMATYHIDLSTTADMSWDVYLSFAVGSETSITQPNPRQWDKYVTGKKLYWRVTNHERTIQSPIMAVVVK